MDPHSFVFNKEVIQEKLFALNSPNRITLQDEFFTNSAVLFALLPNDNLSYNLLLIHRTDRGTKHRGEISFPGGKYEPELDNNAVDTAVREAVEEIGISRGNVELLGCMDDFPTLTRYIITPVIGVVKNNQSFTKQDSEVRRILKIPIAYFAEKANFNERFFKIDHKKFPVFFYNYFDEIQNRFYIIWGATAHMIVSFLREIYQIQLSELGIERFDFEEIKTLKNNIKFKRKLSNGFNHNNK